MGDRHNIGLVQYDRNNEPETILWLYSHWGFYTELVDGFAASLAHALDEARPRWDDESYFNRIVIQTLDGLSGINTGMVTGDEHKRWVVDPLAQEVGLYDNAKWRDGLLASRPEPITTLSFEGFIKKYRKHDSAVRNEY